MPAWRRGAWQNCPAYPQVTAATRLGNRSRGSILPHHPVDLRPRDPGHLPPPSLQVVQQDVVMPASPCLVAGYVAFLRLKLP